MRILYIVAAVTFAAQTSGRALGAQDTLRVLRHTPGDTAKASNLVTVTFDRPVAPALDRTIPAQRLFRIEPATAGAVAWRDPVTIRFIPTEPMTPGARYSVSIDTAVRGLDGSRLEQPFRFSFRVPGPRLLANSFASYGNGGTLTPDGRIAVVYSAPVDLERLRRGARAEIEECAQAPRTIAFRPVVQRALTPKDPEILQRARWLTGNDSTSARFYRVVELEPDATLPLDCRAKIVLPTMVDDSVFGREERYAVNTARSFRIRGLGCEVPWPTCRVNQLALSFATPVRQSDVLRYVRLNSQPIQLTQQPDASRDWVMTIPVLPRTRYVVEVDSAIRDIYGRPLEGSRETSLTTADYVPALTVARGVLTVPRSGPKTFVVRSVNVTAVRIIAYVVPDSLRIRLLTTPYAWGGIRGWFAGLRPDTTIVPLNAPLNVTATTPLPLPRAALAPNYPMVATIVELASRLPEAIPAADAASRHEFTLEWPATYGLGPQLTHAVLQVTDLAVTAKLLDALDGAAFVTDLATGRARGGVTVLQRDPTGIVVGRGVTNANGIATLSRVAFSPRPARVTQVTVAPPFPSVTVLEASTADDHVTIALGGGARAIGYQPGNPINIASLGTYLDRGPPARGEIFPDRGIFRPGEVLHVKGVVRRGVLGALIIPTSDSARVVVQKKLISWNDVDTVVVRDTVLRISRYGSVVDSVVLRNNLPLGDYVAQLQVIFDGEWRSIAATDVRLAEYRAPEFLVGTNSDTTPHIPGDTIEIGVSAKYLLGTPMGRVPVTWSAMTRDVSPAAIPFAWAKGWTISSSIVHPTRSPTELRGVDTLDASGRLQLRVPVAAFQTSLPTFVDVSVAVTDVNRQVVTSRASAMLNPGRLYLLAKTNGENGASTLGEVVRFEVRAVDERGVPLTNVPVSVVGATRRWIAPSPGVAGRELIDTVLARTVSTGIDPASITFDPARAGNYEVVFSAKDRNGTEVRVAMFRQVTPAVAPGESASYGLRAFAEKEQLRPGDTARIHVVSPFPDADAWLTVEREGILEQRRVRIARGDTVLTVPIVERYAPNVHVFVAVVPHTDAATRPDSMTDRFRARYINLTVDVSARRLKVFVAADRASYQPRDTAAISIAVSDDKGRGVRSEVAVWAVDEGVLALTDYFLPNVLNGIYRPRGVGADLWSSVPTGLTTDPSQAVAFLKPAYYMLNAVTVGSTSTIESRPEPLVGALALRSDFKSTAFYLGDVETDARGRATVRPRLPDNLTTFRVLAVAISADDRYGGDDTSLVVTRTIAARPALPRFVRPTDSLLAGAAINAGDGQTHDVNVSVRATGAVVQDPARVKVSVSSEAAREVRFNFLVPPRRDAGDSVVVTLDATDGPNGDAVKSTLPIRPDFSPRTHARIGAVRDSSDVVLPLPPEIDPERSRMRLRIGTSPLSTMLAAYRWLRAYRFDCTEQISSVGRSMIAVWQATKNTNPDALGGDPRPKLQELVDAIVARQAHDGSIWYWYDFNWTSPWLTAYAGSFLVEARDVGVRVDPKVISKINGYLRRELATSFDSGGMNRFERQYRKREFARNVAAVEFLRRSGAPDTARETALLRVAAAMTWEDRLRLAELIASRPDLRPDAEAIVDGALKTLIVVGHRADIPDSAFSDREFPSRVAPGARLLTATLALRPTHPLLGALIETVLMQGRAESAISWSTQDYASVVLALAKLTGVDPVDRIINARVAGTTFRTRRPATGVDSSIVVPLTGLLEIGPGGRPQLRVHLDAAGLDRPIYYAVEVEEVPLAPPVKPDIQGIVVERWYERFSDGAPVVRVNEGDLVRVRLRITVPADRQFVAVEDPLPAGLEPVDLKLRTSASLDAFMSPEARSISNAGDPDESRSFWQSWLYGSWDDGEWSPWQHKELRDDRVVYVARLLWTGSYTASYVARATTAGSFVAPPAHAEEMYNPAAQGRTSGGRFVVDVRR